jgi:hypothetical protein
VVAAQESASAITHSSLCVLSERKLVDCCPSLGSSGAAYKCALDLQQDWFVAADDYPPPSGGRFRLEDVK